MTGMLYQTVNRERALLKHQGRKHPTDAGYKKPKLVLTEKPALSPTVPVDKPVPVPVEVASAPSRAPVSNREFQTVGLHNVPRSLVDALKAEAARRSSKGTRVPLTAVALDCIEIGLAALVKQDV
jgi:hypothetical protein